VGIRLEVSMVAFDWMCFYREDECPKMIHMGRTHVTRRRRLGEGEQLQERSWQRAEQWRRLLAKNETGRGLL
jgi:hypothetical protein